MKQPAEGYSGGPHIRPEPGWIVCRKIDPPENPVSRQAGIVASGNGNVRLRSVIPLRRAWPERIIMFVEQLRRAVEASPRVELARVAQLLWRAYAAGQVSEAEASELSDLIESRRALPAPQRPIQRRLGSRPPRPPRWNGARAGPPPEPRPPPRPRASPRPRQRGSPCSRR